MRPVSSKETAVRVERESLGLPTSPIATKPEWIAPTNTTLGVLMAGINVDILLIGAAAFARGDRRRKERRSLALCWVSEPSGSANVQDRRGRTEQESKGHDRRQPIGRPPSAAKRRRRS